MSNVREFFSLPFKVMEVFGLSQDWNSSWIYRVYGFFIHFAFIDLFTLFHFLFFFHFETIQELSDCAGTFLTNFGQVLKTLNWMMKLKSIKKLVISLEELVSLSEHSSNKGRKKLNIILKRGRFVYTIVYISAIASCLFAGLVPLLNKKHHKLAYRMYFPYLDYTNNDVVFVLLAIYQMSPVFICAVTLSLDCIPVFIICFATGMIEELSDRMKEIGKKSSVWKISESPRIIHNKQTEKTIMKELLQCIEIHLKIKELIIGLQSNFSGVIMVQGILSSIIFCTTAFMLSLVSLYLKSLESYNHDCFRLDNF